MTRRAQPCYRLHRADLFIYPLATMGLFSFLKKKHEPAAEPLDVLLVPDSRLRAGEPSRLDSEAERERQRAIARATAAKIDEIELAMASDIFDDEPAWGSAARRPAAVAASAPPPAPLESEEPPDAPVAPASAPVVEESAILYANGQAAAAESLLRDCLPGFGRGERLPWWMLFDLYQALGRETEFDSIAIDYASHFETSPPTWQPLLPGPAPAPLPGVAASEVIAPVLDAGAAAGMGRLLVSNAPLLRIDLGAVRSATPDGCAALLAALQALRKQERELVLAGADTLLGVLRPMLAVGERAGGAAPWLLLLELLLLSNREKDFEESAMDYCVTFEVSPPSFETPRRVSTAATALAPASAPAAGGDRFLLPPIASGSDAPLLAALDAYADGRDVLVLDCSRLARMDYACATALQARLRPHTEQGRRVELRELNHLVAALLRLLGYGDGIRLYPHRY